MPFILLEYNCLMIQCRMTVWCDKKTVIIKWLQPVFFPSVSLMEVTIGCLIPVQKVNPPNDCRRPYQAVCNSQYPQEALE